MENKKQYSELKKFSLGLGLHLFGVADISGVKKDIRLSQTVLRRVDKAVVLGARLSEAVLQEINQEPTRLYSHHYKTVNTFLDLCALRVADHIQSLGYISLPVPASQILDWKKQTAHLSHRQLGVLAGLGWIGRNNLLVNEKYGSKFRLVSILTDMPLQTDSPVKNDCGNCRACVVMCPSGAIKESPADFDRDSCIEKLKGFSKSQIVDQYICGVCVNVCRGGKSGSRSTDSLSSRKTGRPVPIVNIKLKS